MKRNPIGSMQSLLALAMLAVLSGCGVLVGNPDEKTGDDSKAPKGRVTEPEGAFEPQATTGLFIHLMDAPVDGATAVNVKVNRVEARHAEQGWIEFPSAHQDVINLLAFQEGKTLTLIDGDKAPDGLYQELRLVLDDGYEPNIVLGDSTQAALKIPSGEESGLKIKMDFTVSADTATEMVLDFDLRQSIHQAGKTYQLKPVVRAVEKTASGFITGAATKGATACLYPEGIAPDKDSDCAQALASTVARGEAGFTLAFVPIGTYQVRVFQSDGTTVDYSNVVVTSRETTRVD